MWIVILMYALFASTFTVGKHILLITTPFFFTGVRMFSAGIVLLVIQLIRNPKSLRLPRKIIPHVLTLGVFNVFITNAFEYWGMQYIDSSKACLIYSLSPLFSITLSYFFFNEKMNTLKWLGIGVGFLGFIPIFLIAPVGDSLFKSLTIPELSIIISALTSVVGWMTMKTIIKNHNYSFANANLYSFLIAGVIGFAISPCIENISPLPLYPLSTFIPELLFILLVHNVICYNLYSYSLTHFSVSFMTFAGFVCPIFAEFFGWFFLGESCSWLFFVSIGIIVSGLILYSKGEKQQKLTHTASTNVRTYNNYSL
jgi:drug/metabolite transporter (DMT)-like permease